MRLKHLFSLNKMIYALGSKVLASPDGEERYPWARRFWQPAFDALYSRPPFTRVAQTEDFRIHVTVLDTMVSQALRAAVGNG